MSRGREGSLERGGLVFFGTLTASVTHELNNVLSIVDQARGLLKDLTVGAGAERGVDPRRLQTIQERIERQVTKGVEILNRVNRFAHCLDDPGAEFDVGAEAENLVSLARRFADLKNVPLEYEPGGEAARCTGDSFTLQQCIFLCLQMVLEASEEGDRISVGLRRDGADALISVSGSARCIAADQDPRIRQLGDLMELVRGTHRARTGERGGTVFELRFPVASGRTAAEEP